MIPYLFSPGELWKISDQAHRYAFEFANTTNTGASGNSKLIGEQREKEENNNNNNSNGKVDGKLTNAGGPVDKNGNHPKAKIQAVSSSALKRISAGTNTPLLLPPCLSFVPLPPSFPLTFTLPLPLPSYTHSLLERSKDALKDPVINTCLYLTPHLSSSLHSLHLTFTLLHLFPVRTIQRCFKRPRYQRCLLQRSRRHQRLKCLGYSKNKHTGWDRKWRYHRNKTSKQWHG